MHLYEAQEPLPTGIPRLEPGNEKKSDLLAPPAPERASPALLFPYSFFFVLLFTTIKKKIKTGG